MWRENGNTWREHPHPPVSLSSLFRCRKCATGQNPPKIHPNFTGPLHPNELAAADCQPVEIFGPSFKCPLSKCKRKNLTFREFYYRQCCQGSVKTLSIKNEFDEAKKVDHDFLKNLLHQHKESEIEVTAAKQECDEAQKKFEAAKKKKELKEDSRMKLEDQIALYFAQTVSMITEGNSKRYQIRVYLISLRKAERRRSTSSVQYLLRKIQRK